MISPDGWKLCLAQDDKSQLFDLNKDPGERKNLFYGGVHEDIIAALKLKIEEWQKATGDEVRWW